MDSHLAARRTSSDTIDFQQNHNLLVLKAAWVLPVLGEPIANACILVVGNKIEKIVTQDLLAESVAGRKHLIHDYGRAVILPGFINLHTHLEHTNLRDLAKESDFLDWLPKLMQATGQWSFADRVRSVQQGITEIIAAGTSFVVDSSYNGASIKALAQSGLRALVGLEIFGVDESAADKQWQYWVESRQSFLTDEAVSQAISDGRIAITVAPHAPYTVCPALWDKAQKWSQENCLILLSHLAESKAECNWFRSEDKNLKKFLIAAFSKRDPDFADLYEKRIGWKYSSHSSVEHLHKIGALTDNLLAAHVVQIDNLDIDLLKKADVSIAHCPKSNTTLKCGITPLKKLLAGKLRIGIGTDSAASSGSLDLLSECRFAVNLHQSLEDPIKISAKEVIEFLTIKAAACLKLDHKLGSLGPGKLADIAVFALPETHSSDSLGDPYESIVGGGCELEALFVNGEKMSL